MPQEAQLPTRVAGRHDVAEGVVVIELESLDGSPLPTWTPGAHVDLELAPHLVRQYSLCGDPHDLSRWRIGVLREPAGRGGSSHVHEHLVPGAQVTTRGPRNHFALETAEHYVFIAGGIGITPILPMLRDAAARGATWELHYGGRTLATMAFRDEVASVPGGTVVVHPQDERGLADLPAILATPRPRALVYCCGPEPLLLAAEQATSHWPRGSLHLERFAAKAVDPGAMNGAFEVELTDAGMTLTVGPDESILEVVRAAGVQAWSSCEEGTCGTCETTVVSGDIDHRDSVLSPDEQATNETMMICVSRAACPQLVLKL